MSATAARSLRRITLAAALAAVAATPFADPAAATVGMRIERPEGLDPRERPDAIAGNVLWVVARLTAEMLADVFRAPPAARAGDRLDALAAASVAIQAQDFFIPGAAAAIDPRAGLAAKGLAEPPYWTRIGFDAPRAARNACRLDAGIRDVTGGAWPGDDGGRPDRACMAGYRLALKRWETAFGRPAGDDDEPPLRMRFETAGPELAPYRAILAETELTEAFGERLTGIRLKRPVTLVGRSCGKADAWWDRGRREMVVCYELVRFFGRLTAGDAAAADAPDDGAQGGGPAEAVRHVRLEEPIAEGHTRTWRDLARSAVPDLARIADDNASLFGSGFADARLIDPVVEPVQAGTRLESYGSAQVFDIVDAGRPRLVVFAEFALVKAAPAEEPRQTGLLLLVDPSDGYRVVDRVQTGISARRVGGLKPAGPAQGSAFLMAATDYGWADGLQNTRHLAVAVRNGRFEAVGGVVTVDRETCGRVVTETAALAAGASAESVGLVVTVEKGRDPVARCIPAPVTAERHETTFARDAATGAWTRIRDGFGPLDAFNATLK